MSKLQWLLTACSVVLLIESTVAPMVDYMPYADDEPKPCYFFGQDRFTSSDYRLTNCTWYRGETCCKATEVSAVFSSMFKVNQASPDCKNQLNYLMCYFCSPDQYKWIKGNEPNTMRYKICHSFCDSVYDVCKSATYNDQPLGQYYESGKEFCEKQRLYYSENEGSCFQFDPTVFAQSPPTTLHRPILITLTTVITISQTIL